MGLLEELAVRCEAARGPDRDLEAEIAVAVHGGEIVWKQANYTMEMYPTRKYVSADHIGGFGKAPVDACMTSLDAAMSLVPEGWGWQVSDGGNAGVWSKEPVDVQLADGMRFPGVRAQAGGQAATPALALTAASLRARHALALSKGSEG